MKRIGKLSDIVVSIFIAVYKCKIILRQFYCVKHIIVKIALGRDRECLFLKFLYDMSVLNSKALPFFYIHTHNTYLSVATPFSKFIPLFLIFSFDVMLHILEHISSVWGGGDSKTHACL